MATDVQIERPRSRIDELAPGVLALAGLAATAGFIHLVATIEHIGEEWDLAAFLTIVGAGQLAAGWQIFRNAYDARLLKLVAGASIIVGGLWLLSRTVGVPVGPETGVREVGVGDTVATLLEFGFAGLAAVMLTRGERALAWFGSGMGVRLTCAVLSLCLMMAAFGGHQH